MNLIKPQRFAGGFGRYLEDHNAEDGRWRKGHQIRRRLDIGRQRGIRLEAGRDREAGDGVDDIAGKNDNRVGCTCAKRHQVS